MSENHGLFFLTYDTSSTVILKNYSLFDSDIHLTQDLIAYQISRANSIEEISKKNIDLYVRTMFIQIKQSILSCRFNTHGGKSFLDSSDDSSLIEKKPVSTSARNIFCYLKSELYKYSLCLRDYIAAYEYILKMISHKKEPVKYTFLGWGQRDDKTIQLYKNIEDIISNNELLMK